MEPADLACCHRRPLCILGSQCWRLLPLASSADVVDAVPATCSLAESLAVNDTSEQTEMEQPLSLPTSFSMYRNNVVAAASPVTHLCDPALTCHLHCLPRSCGPTYGGGGLAGRLHPDGVGECGCREQRTNERIRCGRDRRRAQWPGLRLLSCPCRPEGAGAGDGRPYRRRRAYGGNDRGMSRLPLRYLLGSA